MIILVLKTRIRIRIDKDYPEDKDKSRKLHYRTSVSEELINVELLSQKIGTLFEFKLKSRYDFSVDPRPLHE